MAWAKSAGALAPDGGGDWFDGRRDYFVRQTVWGLLHLATWFQEIYCQYHDALVQRVAFEKGLPEPATETIHGELLRHCETMVGTENSKGLLWQLKDLCHRIWPREDPGQSLHGVLFDWVVGSLFHEGMKLKENLYLLHAYGTRTATVDSLAAQIGLMRHRSGRAPLEDIRLLLGQIATDTAQQLERVGCLFSQASYLLRLMFPALMSNRLVVRLLVEEEQAVTALWGESLEDLFASTNENGAAAGFCLAADSFYRGQWHEQALAFYTRALACDRECHEALIQVAQLRAMLGSKCAGPAGNELQSS